MVEIIIIYVIAMFSFGSMIYVWTRIDRKISNHRYRLKRPLLQFIFFNHDDKGELSGHAIGLDITTWLLALLSSAAFAYVVTNRIVNGPSGDLEFVFVVFMFAFIALATIVLIGVLAYEFISQIIKDIKNRD